MNLITKVKHWQVFIFVGMPFIIAFLILPISVIFQTHSFFAIKLLYFLISLWMMSILFYLLLLGIALDEIVDFKNKPNKKIFLLLMTFSICYSLFFISIFTGINPLHKQNLFSPKTYDSFIKLDLTIQKYFSTGFSFES